jgi:vitamin B12 transporter
VFIQKKNLRAFASSRESNFWFTQSHKATKGLLLAATLLPSAVHAQTSEEKTGSLNEPVSTAAWQLPIIVSATGAPIYSSETGHAVTLLNEYNIELFQPSNVSDLLTRTPGITVSNTGPIGGFSAVRIRGAEGEQTLALIDGVRLNDPSSPGGGFDFGNLLIGNIERIEVLRGPNSVPWGSQAIGGVVNMVTQRPTDNLSGSARAEYGSNDRTNFVGNVSSNVGPVGFSIGGGYFRDDGISAAANGTEADGYRQYGANGRVEVALGDNASIDLRGYHSNSRAEADGFPAPTFSLSDTLEYSQTKQLTGYAGFNLALGNLKNRLAATVSDINRDNFASPAATTVDFLARGRNERFEYQGDWQASDAIRAVFGAEHERSKFTDGFSPAKTRYSGAYAQAIVTPVDQLTLTAGGRIDDYKTYGSKATFSANGVWQPSLGTYIRAVYGQGFKAPTLFQLYSFFGDPNLQPEEAQSYELGFDHSVIGGKLRFGATAYQRRVRNMIDFDLSTFTYKNIRRAKAKGIEAFIEVRPSNRLTVAANYTYTDSKTRLDTSAAFTRRIRVPVHSLNLSADWTPINRLKLGADMRLASDSLDGFGGSVRMDGYILLGARAAFEISDAIEIYGRVENAGDADYQTVAGYNAYGRNAHIGVRAKF